MLFITAAVAGIPSVAIEAQNMTEGNMTASEIGNMTGGSDENATDSDGTGSTSGIRG
jgi:hypothetical protein